MTPELSASYSHCEHIAKTQARNFYYSFLTLPPDRKAAMCAIYAFMRYSDDVSDEAAADLTKAEEMQAWRGSQGRNQARPRWSAAAGDCNHLAGRSGKGSVVSRQWSVKEESATFSQLTTDD